MFDYRILDLRPGPQDARSPGWPPIGVETLWKSLILLSLKDRAEEVRLVRRGEATELTYRLSGVWHDLIPPPSDIIPAMTERIRDLSWLPVGRTPIDLQVRGPSELLVWLGNAGVVIQVPTCEGGGVVLQFPPGVDLSLRAHELLQDFLELGTFDLDGTTPPGDPFENGVIEGLGSD